MIRKYLYATILLLILSSFLHKTEARVNTAQFNNELSDSSFISILTSSPSADQVYTVFGHSAIRVCDMKLGIDVVFNYGIFNFDSPNFTYRFMTGETDYMVVPISYKYYVPEYAMRGVEVREQRLNLSLVEKSRIFNFLAENIKPENRVYRYNIFFDNCTTKLRDIIEDHIDGSVIYPEMAEQKTFRDMLHEHLVMQPWLKFGIDIIIGSTADKDVSMRDMMFLPLYEYNIFTDTKLQRGDSVSPLVSIDIPLSSAQLAEDEGSEFFTPCLVGILVLLITLLGAYLIYRNNSILGRILHTLLFLVAGLAGCLVFFLMFFSVHPCTDANWNLMWLNPLQLLATALFFVKSNSKCAYYYHFVNFALLILFLLAWCLIPQALEIAFIPYILALAAVSGTQILKHKKRVL